MPVSKTIKEFFFQNPSSLQNSKRIIELDALRGFIMIIMALDHANEFCGPGKTGSEIWAGQFSSYSGDLSLFFTRFITHLCAPGFFFLMGSGMIFFSITRKDMGWSRFKIWWYFIFRGALLIALQLFVVNPAWKIGSPYMPLYFGVLFSLGGSMILGTLFLEINGRILSVISIALIVFSEILLLFMNGNNSMISIPMRLWFIPGYSKGIFVLYPVIPWIGVLGLGMVFGRFLKKTHKNKFTITMVTGFILIALFFVVRIVGGFGNIRMPEGNDLIGFFNVVKYPPSITFLLISLGMNMVLIGLFGTVLSKQKMMLTFLAIFGCTPLLFYITHLYLYALIGGYTFGKITLFEMYPLWAAGVLLLFPLCALFGRLKCKSSTHSVLRFL